MIPQPDDRLTATNFGLAPASFAAPPQQHHFFEGSQPSEHVLDLVTAAIEPTTSSEAASEADKLHGDQTVGPDSYYLLREA